MNPVSGATIISQSDFTATDTQDKIRQLLNGRQVDLVMSDMAPNATGVKSLDHELIIKLAAKALHFSISVLGVGGVFLTKIWQGDQQQAFENFIAKYFEKVQVVKPRASRVDSGEVFILAKNCLSR